jgi:hypothetical protein
VASQCGVNTRGSKIYVRQIGISFSHSIRMALLELLNEIPAVHTTADREPVPISGPQSYDPRLNRFRTVVAGQAVQLPHHHRRLRLAGCGQGGGKLRPAVDGIGTLAGLHFPGWSVCRYPGRRCGWVVSTC